MTVAGRTGDVWAGVSGVDVDSAFTSSSRGASVGAISIRFRPNKPSGGGSGVVGSSTGAVGWARRWGFSRAAGASAIGAVDRTTLVGGAEAGSETGGATGDGAAFSATVGRGRSAAGRDDRASRFFSACSM